MIQIHVPIFFIIQLCTGGSRTAPYNYLLLIVLTNLYDTDLIQDRINN